MLRYYLTYQIVSCLYNITIVRECNNTDVRLIDGQTIFDGQVEICLNGLWVPVCDDMWTNRDAEVVCRQLGHNGCEFQ